ncbi:hypothetical protein [Winogradskyella ursingii]|uniref:hypothetical protein n=1 Tax=Winogradskyella ursingii TaxID=2686079 RepID=UPI0015C8B753|nr:hypothetical protein [Winogradskyella ursingii]
MYVRVIELFKDQMIHGGRTLFIMLQKQHGKICRENPLNGLINVGQATIISKTAIRVDKEKIEELLTSNDTISEINCD